MLFIVFIVSLIDALLNAIMLSLATAAGSFLGSLTSVSQFAKARLALEKVPEVNPSLNHYFDLFSL